MKSRLQQTAVLIFFVTLTCNLKAQVNQNHYTDHHVHLQDSATVQLGFRMLKAFHQKATRLDSLCFNADTIINRLNLAKFQSAWIISNAYWFGSPLTPVENEYDQVKHQNDWIAAQAARYPGRLNAFMSVNPLKPYALQEIERCAATKRFTGIKLHFANSKVNLFDKAQLKKVKQVFEMANKYKLLLLVHFRSAEKWNGAANTNILLKQLMPFAKNTKVVIAHMAGWGGYDRQMGKALSLITVYLHSANKAHSNLFLDISAVFPIESNDSKKPPPNNSAQQLLAAFKQQVKKIGTDHIVFGTDWPLIDIDPYIELLRKNLGEETTQQILDTRVVSN